LAGHALGSAGTRTVTCLPS